MIAGLFTRAEQLVVLGVAERSIVFLTREAAHQAIRETPFLGDARTIANIYLQSLGAPLLGDEPSQIVGLNLEKECYVSMSYFADGDPFADYVTHEVAHIFHNCKRETVGLPHSRSREWLLEIRFAKRETFAYACEAYGRILEQGGGKKHWRLRLAQYARKSMPRDGGSWRRTASQVRNRDLSAPSHSGNSRSETDLKLEGNRYLILCFCSAAVHCRPLPTTPKSPIKPLFSLG